VQTLDSYLRGEVYEFDVDNGQDYCSGFYSIEDAIECAKSDIGE